MNENCCVCYNFDFDDLIYQSKSVLNILGQKKAESKKGGSSFSGGSKIDKLESYLKLIEDEKLNINFGGKGCLDCDKLQSISEKIRRITATCEKSIRKNLFVDNSMEEKWIAQNPYCVAREKWEELAYRVCAEFKIDIESIEEKCDITFEIVRSLIPCDLMVSLSVYEEVCDLKLEINRTEEECKIDFELLKSEVECDLNFRTYKTLIENNFSYDIIKNIYENGCTIVVDDSEIRIHTAPFEMQYV